MTIQSDGYANAMGRDAVLEQEVKFEAPIGLALPDLRRLVGRTVRLPEEQLSTTYFDTMDHRLWQQGLTLRHRRTAKRGDGTWTLKLPDPSNGSALRRTEVTWPGPGHEMPSGVNDVLRGVIRREPLRQLVVLETRRQRLVLRDDQDKEVGELDDDLVLVVGGPRDGVRFRQVELELYDPGWNGHKVMRRLETAGVRIESTPKVAKAIDLPHPPPRTHSVEEGSTVADVVRTSLRAEFDRLLGHDWRLRLAQPGAIPEDVHQARVATRRLRSDLKTFGGVLDPVWLQHTRSDLKWLGTALGEVRDLDVLGDQFTEAPYALCQRLAGQRAAASQRLAEVLASGRYLDLVDRLHAGSERLPIAAGAAHEAHRAADDVLPALVAARWRAVRRQVRRAGPHPSPEQLHRIRIKAKQLRYAAEAAVPIIGKPARETASSAERVQTVLGQHHDAVAAEVWLRDEWRGDSAAGTAPTASPAVSFEAGRLVAETRRRQRKSQRNWTRAWAKLGDPKHRRWLPDQ